MEAEGADGVEVGEGGLREAGDFSLLGELYGEQGRNAFLERRHTRDELENGGSRAVHDGGDGRMGAAGVAQGN